MKTLGWLCPVPIGLMICTVLWMPVEQRVWTWAIVCLWMVFFVFCLGAAISSRPLGILIDEQNLMSLSRFQTTLWSVIIVSALLVIASVRLRDGVSPDKALNINFSVDVLSLLGITTAALVGSPLIDSTKKSKTPAPTVAGQTAAVLLATNNVPTSVDATAETAAGQNPDPGQLTEARTTAMTAAIHQNAQGLLYKNPKISDAAFSDMFEGTEVGNAAHIDLARVQMFLFTLIVALAYVYSLSSVIAGNTVKADDLSFPALSDGMVALLGISNGGYLGAKAVDHTKT